MYFTKTTTFFITKKSLRNKVHAIEDDSACIDCDLDLHNFEPDGTEIWYRNMGPTDNTGTLDIDMTSRPENATVMVENHSWVTGPAGTYTIDLKNFYCNSTVDDFKIYVQIDGKMTVHGGKVPDEYTRIRIGSFHWSP